MGLIASRIRPVVDCEHQFDGAHVAGLAVHLGDGQLLELTTAENVRRAVAVVTVTRGRLDRDGDELAVVIRPDLFDHVSERGIVRRGKRDVVHGTGTHNLVDAVPSAVGVLSTLRRINDPGELRPDRLQSGDGDDKR